MISKLKTKIKLNDEEICKMHRKLEECKKQCDKLGDINKTLEMDLKCTKTKIVEEKMCATRMEEKFKAELKTLTDELTNKCQKLRDMELLNVNANRTINDMESKARKFVTKLMEHTEANEKNHENFIKQIQKLKEENYTKDDEICRFKREIKKLQRQIECTNSELCTQKKELDIKENQMKHMKSLMEKFGNIKQLCENCCPENKNERNSSNACIKPTNKDTCCCLLKNSRPLTNKCEKKSSQTNIDSVNELKKLQCELDKIVKFVKQ